MSAVMPRPSTNGVWRRLRRASAAELLDRGGQVVDAWLERRGLRNVPGPAESRAFRWLGATAARDLGTDAERWLRAFRSPATPRYTAALRDRSATVRALRVYASDAVGEVMARADEAVSRRFDLLAYRAVPVGQPVDWHADPVHGIRAPSGHWSTIRYLDPQVAGDHKVIWELNRHQFLVTLGQAYWLSGDERYAESALALVDEWIDANPPAVGINWASSLEVALRALSWLWFLALVRDAACLTPRRFVRMMDGLALSARHIERFLSTYFSPNTHLTGEALGLYAIGQLCPELRHARRWRERGLAILEREVTRHVLADGVYFERSTYYHRYTTDIFLHAAVLSRAAGGEAGGAIRGGLERLLEHLMFVTRPDGTIPRIGDDDGGRLLPLDGAAPHDVRATLGAGAAMFGRADFACVAGGVAREAIWLLGADAGAALVALGSHPPDSTSRAFPEGGVFVMRDGWHATASVLVADAGPHGVLNCGHAHADALSFDLTLGGVPLFVDPGTFTYTVDPRLRDHFRATPAHNAVSVDGRSSSEPAGPFTWSSMARCVATWSSTGDVDVLDARHDGYRRLAPPVDCRRLMLHVRDAYWVIVDAAESAGPHEVAVTFQCARNIGAVADARGVVRLTHGAEPIARLHTFPCDVTPVIEEGMVSERYGAWAAAPRLRYAHRSAARVVFTTVIVPSMGPEPRLHDHRGAGGTAIEIAGSGYRDLVIVDGIREPIAPWSVVTDAALCWVRRTAEGEGRLQVVGARTLVADGVDLSPHLRDGDIVAMERIAHGWHVHRGAR